MTRPCHTPLVTVLIATLPLAACSRTASLDGAKVDIPVFSPSSLEDQHEATTSDDLSNIAKFRTTSWDLSTSAPWEQVDAFYLDRLTGATRDDENTPVPEDESPLEDEVRYFWVPEGWTGGAKVMVLIQKTPEAGKTRFRISQDVLNR